MTPFCSLKKKVKVIQFKDLQTNMYRIISQLLSQIYIQDTKKYLFINWCKVWSSCYLVTIWWYEQLKRKQMLKACVTWLMLFMLWCFPHFRHVSIYHEYVTANKKNAMQWVFHTEYFSWNENWYFMLSWRNYEHFIKTLHQVATRNQLHGDLEGLVMKIPRLYW